MEDWERQFFSDADDWNKRRCGDGDTGDPDREDAEEEMRIEMKVNLFLESAKRTQKEMQNIGERIERDLDELRKKFER